MSSTSCHPRSNNRSVSTIAFVISTILIAAPATSLADDAVGATMTTDDVAVSDSFTALPGLHRVGSATLVKTWATIALSAGYGASGAVLDTDDSHSRIAGTLALSLRPLPWLGFALRLDNSFNFHSKVPPPEPEDTNFLTDPRLTIRAIRALGDRLTIGGELRLWVPSDVVGPNIPGAALQWGSITPDLVFLATYRPFDALAISGNLGFRLDRSGDSVDDWSMLNAGDRMSLGISAYNAALLGVGAAWRTGPIEIFGEWSWDVLLGDEVELGNSPNRLGAGARYRINPSVQVQLLVEGSISTLPAPVEVAQLQIPIEPSFQGMASVTFQRSSSKRGLGSLTDGASGAGALGVVVVDEAGAPVEGARVSVRIDAGSTDIEPDNSGRFVLAGALPDDASGEVEIVAVAEGYRDTSEIVDLDAERTDNEIRIVLRPVPQVGQLRGVIQSFRGRPIRGTTIRVEPVGLDIVPKGGFFEVDLEPGTYTVIIRAPGYQEQQVKAVVTPNAVKILNVDLRRARKKKKKRRGRRR